MRAYAGNNNLLWRNNELGTASELIEMPSCVIALIGVPNIYSNSQWSALQAWCSAEYYRIRDLLIDDVLTVHASTRTDINSSDWNALQLAIQTQIVVLPQPE